MKIKKIKVITNNDDKKTRETRVYFFPNETIFENLMNRRCRPLKEYRKLLPEVYKKAKISSGTVANWSQKAGCSCGCAPGFILKEHTGSEIFVDLH